MTKANKFISILSIKNVITTFFFIHLLSIFAVSLTNPEFLGYSHYSEIFLDAFNILFSIFFLTCTYYLYKFLKSDHPSFVNIAALYYSIYITTGIFFCLLNMGNYPLTLGLASHHYPDASDSFHNTFHDMGYQSITDDMGIILFNHYLYQHLENEPMWFLPHLVCLEQDQVIVTFANNQDMLKDCILEYNTQKKAAILDSYNTLDSIVKSVVERASSELNIDLLQRHSINEWLDVYIRNLQDNPIFIEGTKYIIKYDDELGIPYLVDIINFDTFQFGFQQMVAADARMDDWASARPQFLRAIIKGVMKKPSLDILSIHRPTFRNAFLAEKKRMEFEEEANRLNAIDFYIFD